MATRNRHTDRCSRYAGSKKKSARASVKAQPDIMANDTESMHAADVKPDERTISATYSQS
jgi:hypothetical protein